ncbi:hypothetical protein FRC09_009254 [Ceratobasidium sp. 395]|nr:hypothetical protein FRC09_009254 [Ceratobasidium sp. 395]
MLFGRALTTLVVSLMATLAIAAPTTAAAPSTHLTVRQESEPRDAPAGISLAGSSSSSDHSPAIQSIISQARSDLDSIMNQLTTLDFEKNGTQSLSQVATHFQTAVVHFVGNVVAYSQTEEGNKVMKRDIGGLLGLDPVALMNDGSTIVKMILSIVNRVSQVIANPARGPDAINQIGAAIHDILGTISGAVPTVISIVLRILAAVR